MLSQWDFSTPRTGELSDMYDLYDLYYLHDVDLSGQIYALSVCSSSRCRVGAM